jgi:hypothetical protein
MPNLSSELRNRLENTAKAARRTAEAAAKVAVERLTVGSAEPGTHLSVEERQLRNRLRAHGRQLGDQRDTKTGAQSIDRLKHECAYEHWHRMLFARFLAENHLLIHEKEGMPVTLAECDELAVDEGAPDGWTLAARYAARMLPQIFRPDDPVLQVGFALEHKRALERLVTELPVEVFTAEDSLGWVYQFWQAERKDEVNASGDKITGETLPAVTQLFTEHYMVLFLLHNTIGAWWAARLKSEGRILKSEWDKSQTEDDCRKLVALPGYDFTYLRFIKGSNGDWVPAGGGFPGWPRSLKDFKLLDPCCGSGHFLVAAFVLLVQMRMQDDKLSAKDACDAVLRENLHGLELDPRCTQIAAFALALTAWRFAECPPALMPLAELQYRGAFWSQVNHKDWTVLAFLQSADGGLGLDVARDNATLDAMKTALVKLVEMDIQDLTGHRLEASDFHALLSPDPVREILAWMNDPKAAQAKLTAQQWDAFCHSCKDKFGLHPTKDGPLRAAELMGLRQGNWGQVWERFREAPRRYPILPGWLRKAKPQDDDLFLKESDEVWPQSNEIHETALRIALNSCEGKSAQTVIQRIRELEAVHGKRRSWVWAELDQAPLAVALKHLTTLVRTCGKPVAGGSLEDMVASYVNDGWCADAAVVDALSLLEKKDDIEAVQAVIRAVYLPWLEASALAFQRLVTTDYALIRSKAQASVSDVAKGTAILFADGLRFDLAQKLKAKLADKGLQVELSWRWTALPPVTPTAKPAASPITDLFTGDEACEEFRPRIRDGGKDLTSERFKQLLNERGCQVLSDKKLGQPDRVAWLECGSIDSTGHKEGWKLAKRLPEELNGLAGAIVALLEGGWKTVKVVTDHGWLLMPGGLPKLDLPKFLTETRWGRCALIKEGVHSEMPSVPWHWASTVHVAVPSGVGAFNASLEYAHGGLSVQECLVPELTISSAAPAAADISISSVKWVGLRCRIQASSGAAGLTADIRESIADKATSLVAKPKEIEADGQTSLLVPDDRKAGMKATVVLVDASDAVVAKFPTVIGV